GLQRRYRCTNTTHVRESNPHGPSAVDSSVCVCTVTQHQLQPSGARMKKLLLVSVAGVALVVAGAVNSADAADIYRKAPPPAPAPAYVPPPFSWTGCYVGAQLGWGWGRKNVTQARFESGGALSDSFSSSSRVDTS